MADTTCQVKDKFRAELDRFVSQGGAFYPALAQALMSLGTAMDYEDPALARHHLESVFEHLRDMVQEGIFCSINSPEILKEILRKVFGLIEGEPSESYDELGEQLKSRIERHLDSLTTLERTAQRVMDRGHHVDKIEQLRNDIEEIEKLRDKVVSTWPWTSRPLPPVNRKMVAESRAARARGDHGEPIQDLIRRLGGNPDKGG
jgi:hypothetical protein